MAIHYLKKGPSGHTDARQGHNFAPAAASSARIRAVTVKQSNKLLGNHFSSALQNPTHPPSIRARSKSSAMRTLRLEPHLSFLSFQRMEHILSLIESLHPNQTAKPSSEISSRSRLQSCRQRSSRSQQKRIVHAACLSCNQEEVFECNTHQIWQHHRLQPAVEPLVVAVVSSNLAIATVSTSQKAGRNAVRSQCAR